MMKAIGDHSRAKTAWRNLASALVCALFAALLHVAPTQAQIISNGSFESGTTGWVFSVPDGGAGGGGNPILTGAAYAQSGTHSLDMWYNTTSGATTTATQTFTVATTGTYTLQFYAFAYGNPGLTAAQSFTVTIGGQTYTYSFPSKSLFGGTNNGYTLVSIVLNLTAGSNTLVFKDTSGLSDNNYALLIDNISINAAPGPLPGGGLWSWLGGALFFGLRRRRRIAAALKPPDAQPRAANPPLENAGTAL
ncbi:MAG: hypothetical protein KGL46_08115 [Hyphomicrobiales bacterium]|nr:hypothetical protein [Hyphomicrobiales bacterium]